MTSSDTGLVGRLMELPIFEAEWVLWLLFALSLLSVAVMLERAWFYRSHAVDADALRARLSQLLSQGDMAAASRFLQGYDSLETNTVLFGLREHHMGADSVQDLVEGATATETERYQARLGFLATVGSNAPFIGLFGTVLGIIQAFSQLQYDLTSAGPGLMGAISEALVATGVGLFVAIPAVIAYNWFGGQVQSRLASSQLLARTLLSHLKAEHANGRQSLPVER